MLDRRLVVHLYSFSVVNDKVMERRATLQLSVFVITATLASRVLLCYGSTESDANSVEIKLYPASLSDWPSSTEATFKTTLADQTTTYCGANPSSCGLDNGNTFSSADVTVHSKSESSRSLKLSVYVSYPTGSNVTSGGSTTEHVPQTAFKAILKAARDTVKANIDMYITYIGSDYYGVPPESKANGIIIPIAAVTVVAVGISAVVMVYVQESREKKERAAARLAKKRALKAVPNYNIQEVPDTSELPTSEIPEDVNYGDQNNSKISQALNNNHEVKKRPEASTTTAAASTQPSVNHFHHNGNISSTLPPLSGNSNKTVATTTTGLSTDTQQEQDDQKEIEQQWELQHHHHHHQDQQQQQQQQPQQFQHASLDESEEDARKKRKKEKKREKKRLLMQQRQQQQQLLELEQEGFELHDNQAFDTSAMTISENSAATPRDNIPTFTVQRRGDVLI